MVGFSGSYDFISANIGFTSTYWAVGGGLSVAPESLSFPVMSDTKLSGSMNIGITIWDSAPYRVGNLYIPNAGEIQLHQMEYNGGW
jgi:hypothetical protein